MKKYLYIVLIFAFILSLVFSGCSGGNSGGETYTVTYNGNGNTGGNAPTDGTRYTPGQTVTVLGKNTLTKVGVFAGWTNDANNNGTIYNQGDTFTMSAANVTLNAKWALFCENFSYTAANDWTPINGWTKYDSNISIPPNSTVKWNIASGGNSGNALEYYNNSYPAQLINDYSTDNCTISVQVKPVNITSGRTFGVIGRAQDEKNYYAVEVYYLGTDTYWRLIKTTTTSMVELKSQKMKDGTLDQNTFYILTLTLNGNSMTGAFSGGGLSPLNITASDATWGSGKVGIEVGNLDTAFHIILDNFLVF